MHLSVLTRLAWIQTVLENVSATESSGLMVIVNLFLGYVVFGLVRSDSCTQQYCFLLSLFQQEMLNISDP